MSAEYEGDEDPMSGVPKLVERMNRSSADDTPASEPRVLHVRRQDMSNRRTFMAHCVKGAAGFAVSGLASSRRILGANDRIRFGLIGCGSRGKENYSRPPCAAPMPKPSGGRRLHAPPGRGEGDCAADQHHKDYRQLIDDKSVDAVLIATPQHQHALNFVPAIQAGKDVYQEKTMAFSPNHAKRMRRRSRGGARGPGRHPDASAGPAEDGARYTTPERMGVSTAIHTHHYRNAAYGGWMRDIPPDCDANHVDWRALRAKPRPALQNRNAM